MALTSLRPLRSRNFALVWSSALVSNVGSWMQTVALGTLVTLQTHNAFWTALTLAAGFIPMGLLAPLGGVLADRLDRRKWLIVTTLAEAAFAASLAVVVAMGLTSPGLLVLLSFLGGSAGAIGFPSYQSMLPDLVDRDDLLAAVSLSSAQWNMGRVVGPAIAGVVLVVWSPAAAFAVNAASFFAVVLALGFVRLPVHQRSQSEEGVIARLRNGARAAADEPGCRAAIALISVVALLGSPFIGLVAAMAIDGLHRRAGGPAVLTTAQGIGAVLGALALAPMARRFGQQRVVSVAVTAFSISLILYGLASTLPEAAGAIFFVGGTYIWVLSGLNTVVQLRAPEAMRGRILSLYMMALGTIYPIGLILQGAIAQHIGVRTMTVISGVLVLIAVGTLLSVRPAMFRALSTTSLPQGQTLDVTVPEVAEVDLSSVDDLD